MIQPAKLYKAGNHRHRFEYVEASIAFIVDYNKICAERKEERVLVGLNVPGQTTHSLDLSRSQYERFKTEVLSYNGEKINGQKVVAVFEPEMEMCGFYEDGSQRFKEVKALRGAVKANSKNLVGMMNEAARELRK